jgi:transcriptional regulator with XRE-family HTH domain
MPKRSQTPPKYPNHLREQVHNNGLTLNEVAQETDIPLRTLSDYCSGKVHIPRQRLTSLAQLIGCAPEEIVPKFEAGEASAEHTTFNWHIPYPRNPFFTGREQLLQELYDTFDANTSNPLTHIQALCGLGGVGKTHLALEYAYRYHHAHDAVFWLKADTRENLLAEFVGIAQLLSLPEQHAEEQMIIVTAVLRWLETHTKWLLIFDNADDLSILPLFMPPAFGGHILLTTRAQAVKRLAHRVTVECMTVEIGTLLLLRRAGILSSQAPLEQTSANNRLTAFQIVEELGGLPLAISILHLCAFLDPDAIPEEILKEGLRECVPTEGLPVDELRINAALEVLLRFSLIQRNTETHMLTIHRLVQIVIQDSMDEETQRIWARKAAFAVKQAFPQSSHMYSASGYPYHAVQLLKSSMYFEQEKGDNEKLATTLWSLAVQQQVLGKLSTSEKLLQECILLCHQSNDPFNKAKAYQYLALLRAYQGMFEESLRHLDTALSLFRRRFCSLLQHKHC